MSYYTLPYVYEREGIYERSWDIYSRLLKDRIIFIGTIINDYVANSIVAQLLFLQMSNPDSDIHIYLNSPGGSITAGLAILDTMKFIKCHVKTYCIGTCSNVAALLLSAGTKGSRYALPHSRIVLYQPIGSIHGQASDILIAANEIKKWRNKILELFNLQTGQTLEKLKTDTNRIFAMSSYEAKTYGIIDDIIV